MNIDYYRQLLAAFVACKSVSTDSQASAGIAAAVDWLDQQFRDHQFTVEIVKGYGNPIVLAHLHIDRSLPTCLIYGHYDVQPAAIEDGWDSDPFVVQQRGERLYGRGVVDNKGQILLHMVTVFELAQQNRLGYNITFMIEGDEETGSELLGDFIRDYQAQLASDVALISDGEIGTIPTLEVGFRGGFNMTVSVRTASIDAHSGIFGGVLPNAAEELSRLLAGLKDNNGTVLVQGFYDDVDQVPAVISNQHEALRETKDHFLRLTGARALYTDEPAVHPWVKTGLYPTLEVTGISSGYAADGYRNSIPATAIAKINVRLVLSQNAQYVATAIQNHLQAAVASYAIVTCDIGTAHQGVKLSSDSKYIQHAQSILQQSHGVTPVCKYCGGGLPVVTLFTTVLEVPVVSASLGNDDCGMHAPNENFHIKNITQGQQFSRLFLQKAPE